MKRFISVILLLSLLCGCGITKKNDEPLIHQKSETISVSGWLVPVPVSWELYSSDDILTYKTPMNGLISFSAKDSASDFYPTDDLLDHMENTLSDGFIEYQRENTSIDDNKAYFKGSGYYYDNVYCDLFFIVIKGINSYLTITAIYPAKEADTAFSLVDLYVYSKESVY